MRHPFVLPVLLLLCHACASLGSGAAPARTAVTAEATRLEMSPEELRIRVRALIRPAVGIVEESADRMLRKSTDPEMRRMLLVWKVEATTTLMAALLRPDPLLALADAWGYALQMEAMSERADVRQMLGESQPQIVASRGKLASFFRDFARTVPVGIDAEAFETAVRAWARENPIEGELYRRPSMDSAAAALLAGPRGQGVFTALGGLEETTQDVMTRMDLYTMYLPRLARWEALIAVEDATQGVDPAEVLGEFERFTRAVDRIAASVESAPDLVAGERQITLEVVRTLQATTVRDLRAEREIVLDEVEAIARRLLEGSGGPIRAAVREDAEALLAAAERAREPLIDDLQVSLEGVVDHAFYRALQLLLAAAALAAVGAVLYARVLRP
jgi:hypothetical protein